MKKIFLFGSIILLFAACSKNHQSDAYGNFETVETLISAEANGKLNEFTISEGDQINTNIPVGLIDTISLYLQKRQLTASKKAVESKIKNILSEINVYKEQLITLTKDQKRISKLFETGAATQKQLDDINGSISVTKRRIEAIETQNAGVLSEIQSLDWKVKSMEDQIQKCIVKNPVKGTVLEKYAEENEFVNLGKPLYKIARLDEITLRVYLSGSQLSSVKIGQKVQVLFDKDEDSNSEVEGIITWISSQSEFTPKIIQTKEERVKLVYAVKVKVKNDGRIKIGMPGEVIF